ncbi:MAG: HlyD family efflux transporter periplasmic adaptor subunit [Candidatus Kerfeldbacteria bacterium]|nr:HlyD family efflux transporter periplasmic adaptor subunit [Candidatus Kerfeldbacteria bacterium]
MSQLPKPPTRPWYKRWWLWLFVILLVIAGIAIAGYIMTAGQATTVDTSQTITATVRDLTKAVSTNGKVAPEHSEQLAFSFGGKVTAVYFKVGDEVNKDAILAKVGSQQLKAPFDGRVLAVNTFVGNTATPGVAVFEIGYRTNFVDFIASESEVFDLAAGQQAELTIPTYDNGATTYHGTVELVDTKKTTGDVMNAQTGTSESGYLVRIRPTDLPASAANLIGLTINIKVLVEEKLAALSVERAAIQYNDNDEAYVWLPGATPDALPLEQPVVTGFEGDDYIEIVSGVQAADTIVLNIPQAETGSLF